VVPRPLAVRRESPWLRSGGTNVGSAKIRTSPLVRTLLSRAHRAPCSTRLFLILLACFGAIRSDCNAD
jgi:hypothetical protein